MKKPLYRAEVLLTTGERGFIASELTLDKRYLVMVSYNLRWVDANEIITT